MAKRNRRASPDRSGLIYKALRSAIIEQALVPGDKLPEDAIGERFGVSRTIVRHALGRLSAEGLVELRRHRGAAVATPSWDEARDIFDVRIGLERLVVGRLVGRLDADQVKALEAHVDAEEHARGTNEPLSIRLATEFHIILAEMTGSPVIARYINEIASRCGLILALYSRPHSSECAVSEHRASRSDEWQCRACHRDDGRTPGGSRQPRLDRATAAQGTRYQGDSLALRGGDEVRRENSVAPGSLMLLLGTHARRSQTIDADLTAMLERFPRLRERLALRAGLLSGGEQQMLAIARGLMARPRVLLLDEPSLGLAPTMVNELFDVLAELRDEGVTILLVDQMAILALTVADRGYVLESGRIVRADNAAALAGDPDVEAAYLGRAPAAQSTQ